MISFQSNDTRLKRISEFATGKIMDIGYVDYPNPYLVGEVTGIDIQSSKKELPPNYMSSIKCDVKGMKKKLKGSRFDTIVASEFIEHIDNHLTFLRDCHFLLKRHGLLILSTPTPFYYMTLIGNVFLKKGRASNKDHHSVFIPRILNKVADEIGFDLVDIKPATSVYIPFMTYQLIYVYKKRDNHD